MYLQQQKAKSTEAWWNTRNRASALVLAVQTRTHALAFSYEVVCLSSVGPLFCWRWGTSVKRKFATDIQCQKRRPEVLSSDKLLQHRTLSTTVRDSVLQEKITDIMKIKIIYTRNNNLATAENGRVLKKNEENISNFSTLFLLRN